VSCTRRRCHWRPHLFLTELALDVPEGDTFFPELDSGQWRVVHREVVEQLTFTDLERVD
jgi:dihydrofolate reductase